MTRDALLILVRDSLRRLDPAWCALHDRQQITALDVAERYVNGAATGNELAAARTMARRVVARAAADAARVAAADAAAEAVQAVVVAEADAIIAAKTKEMTAGAAAWSAARDRFYALKEELRQAKENV